MSAEPSAPVSGIRLSVGALIRVPDSDGRLVARVVAAGEPLPYTSLEDVPEALRGFVVEDGDIDEQDDPLVTLNRVLGERYGVDDRGRLHRKGRKLLRQAEEMLREQQEQELAIEALERPLPEETEQHLQDSHDAAVAQQLAQAEISAQRADELHSHLLEEQDEQLDDDAELASEPMYLFSAPGVGRRGRG
jgi:hypothetical protein